MGTTDIIQLHNITSDSNQQQSKQQHINKSRYTASLTLVPSSSQQSSDPALFDENQTFIEYRTHDPAKFFIQTALLSAMALFLLYLIYLLAMSRVSDYFTQIIKYFWSATIICVYGDDVSVGMPLILASRDILNARKSIEPLNFIISISILTVFLLLNLFVLIAFKTGMIVGREECFHDIVAKFSVYRNLQALQQYLHLILARRNTIRENNCAQTQELLVDDEIDYLSFMDSCWRRLRYTLPQSVTSLDIGSSASSSTATLHERQPLVLIETPGNTAVCIGRRQEFQDK